MRTDIKKRWRWVYALLLCLFCMTTTANAQSYERNGNTFVQTTHSQGTKTPFTYKDKNGEYPIYVSANGSCYVLKTSKKSGKEYRKGLGEEISREICRELKIEYKVKPKEKKS